MDVGTAVAVVAFFSSFSFVSSLKREKRYLVYSSASKLQLVFGAGLPIHLENTYTAATIGWVIKSAYVVPQNSTFYTDPYTIQQRKRSLSNVRFSRYDLYKLLQKRLLHFHSSGSDCLLRAICETTRLPFRGEGVVSRILDIFFRPSATEDRPETREELEYHIAEQHGRNGNSYSHDSHARANFSVSNLNCKSRYPSCNLDIIEWLTVVI